MPRVDETSYGAHGFTVDWWRELPEAFRVADRVQGETLAPAWDGLNRDPRFVTGFDGWDRANTSTKPWVVSFTMTRTFKVTPNVPVIVRSWHTPYLVGTTTVGAVDVRHTIRDYADAIVTTTTGRVTTDHGTHETWVTPDRFGQLTVAVDVSLNMGQTSVDPTAKNTMDVLAAIHVGTRDVAFDELPDLASFTINKPYPLLRFMDGVGHQAGFLDDQLAHMWDGETFNPVTAPEQWLRFLGTIMGLPRTYMGRLTLPQLRAHLVAFTEQGRPPIGSRRNIAEVAKQWLSGDKQVSVVPANSMPSWPTAQDRALLQKITGNPTAGRVIVSAGAPVPAVEYRWAGAPDASVSQMYRSGRLAAENRTPNPGFRADLTGWYSSGADITRDTTTFEMGPAAMRITPTQGSWYAITGYLTQPTYSYVRARWRVYSTTGRTLHPKVWLYDPSTSTTGDAVTIPAGQWTTVEGRFLVDADRRHRLGLVPAATDQSTTPLFVDRVYIARDSYLSADDFDGATPDSSINDVWVKPGTTPAVSVWDQDKRWVTASGDHTTAAQAVIDADTRQDRVHTLLMFVRADELPRRDLKAFQQFMQDSGVIPAGHRLVCLESRSTWDQWENAVGPTWRDLETRTKTWTDSESAGVTLDF